jgi:uncharacterized membrane protein
VDSPPTGSLRARYNHLVVGSLDRAQLGLASHWLALTNCGLVLILALPILAPVLVAIGQPQLAAPIYWIYRLVCHEWPFRSFFLFGQEPTYSIEQIAMVAGPDAIWDFAGNPQLGYKMAFCERDLAIVLAALGMGLLYIRYRRRLAPPRLLFYLLFLLPIAIDGFTQLPGWRESTWEYRVSTGAIAGVATVWLLFPYLQLRADRFLATAASSRQEGGWSSRSTSA